MVKFIYSKLKYSAIILSIGSYFFICSYVVSYSVYFSVLIL
nr:MAG TPA: hypothetical protein [Caudoviricetes sp.]